MKFFQKFLLICFTYHIFTLISSVLFAETTDIFNLNIKQLMNIEVKTPNRIQEKLIKSNSAIYIITSEDIQRSGYTTLPDLLKMVPGVDVVRVDSSKWGVTIRGFNGVFANKLMVLIDGINIYNHLFSGVFWDIQSIPLETIERIEVIRGASGTMWGANAVNGVINIITKKTSNTKKLSFTSAYGKNTDDSINLFVNYKNFILDINFQDYYKVKNNYIREEPIYLKGLLKFNYVTLDDNFQFLSHFTSAKIKNKTEIPIIDNITPEMINVDGRYNFDYQLMSFTWRHSFSESNESKLLIYYINSNIASFYNNPKRFVHRHVTTKTITIDFQDNFKISNHNILWGGEYRWDRDSTNKTDFTLENVSKKTFNMYNFFISDKISLSKKISFSLGTKYEYNDSISSSALLSTIKLSYFPSNNITLWFSFSNSVRTPSSLETDALLPIIQIINTPNNKIVAKLFSSNNFDYEKLYSYEMGFKKFISSDFYFDIALFYNHYRDLSVLEDRPIYKENNYFILPFGFKNNMSGNVYGFETWSKIKLNNRFILTPYYSYCYFSLNDHGSIRDESKFYRNSYPTYKFGSKIQLNLPYNIKLDSLIFYKNSLPYYKIGDYLSLDLKLSFTINRRLSISLVGTDLLKNKHREFNHEIIPGTEKSVERSIFLKVSLSQ